MTTRSKVILILALEKVLQHVITAALFATPWLAKPNIGTRFDFSSSTMTVLNLGMAAGFGWGTFRFMRFQRGGLAFIIGLAALDIVFEAAFHAIGFITVSVLVSTAILLTSWRLPVTPRAVLPG